MSTRTMEAWVLGLLGLHVAFLLLHDWVPLGRLTNREGVRGVDSTRKLLITTLLSGLPWVLGFAWCCVHWSEPRWPGWLVTYLRICYGILLAGAIQAWWIPYLVRPEPERAARYQVRFAGTLTFLPERNGIAPDALHVVFHATVVAMLVLLFSL